MNQVVPDDDEDGLILAAEECPPEKFQSLHFFSGHDDIIVRKLSAHGPVLVRGGRGSGKSALLIEAHRRMRKTAKVFSVYLSLRYLPLLQSDGPEYITHFCGLLSKAILEELKAQGKTFDFSTAENDISLQQSLNELAQKLNKRIVLLFDDAAHIGREKPLEVFFDLFRTLSTNTTSCKASIYPGVTRFGLRFDVFNDSTVIDVSRSDVSGSGTYFLEVLKSRYPELSNREIYSDRLHPEQFANLVGRAVVGNMRGFILACNRFDSRKRVGVPEVTACLLALAEDYFWPLMDEVAPKLGVYEPLVEPARSIFEAIVENAVRPVKSGSRTIAQDKVTIHRDLVGHYAKVFEILEYLGFVAKREASRGLKSGGRGPVYAINICSLLDQIPQKRLTLEMIDEWVSGKNEPAEIHSTSQLFGQIKLPALQEESGLEILQKPLDTLVKSRIYPYGLTLDKIGKLKAGNFTTVGEVATSSYEELDAVAGIGHRTIERVRNVVFQAIWM
ncbi:ATP-binding protein [Agrobacterium tumefaciens]|uniref:ATP-binding protein n=1 Tax=Agrobacterium tumefaciens TaxID=358 RepID=UPI0015722F4E|nr:ATP-binding protein [Agrobacterium tumefaciens]NTE66191.1 ATP-binding protein [Agrobacterium tumefaciens]